MTEHERTPIPDPSAQHTDREDTSITPELEAKPAEAETRRTDNLETDDPRWVGEKGKARGGSPGLG